MRPPRQFDFVQWVEQRVLLSQEGHKIRHAFVCASSMRIAEQDVRDAFHAHPPRSFDALWHYDHACAIWLCAVPEFALVLTTHSRLDEAQRGRIPVDLRRDEQVWQLA